MLTYFKKQKQKYVKNHRVYSNTEYIHPTQNYQKSANIVDCKDIV